MPAPRLIGLDWGTSALRAFLLDGEGTPLEAREAPAGIQTMGGTGFRAAFESVCADWLADAPALPAIACGMVGSRQGWREAPYVPTPAGFAEIAAGLLRIDAEAGRVFALVPGVHTRAAGGTHDVMRGEETQVFGALQGARCAAGAPAMDLEPAVVSGPSLRAAGETVVVLPGTHSKWVTVRAGRIAAFRTYMTGELYAVLGQHSILGRLFGTPPAPSASTPLPAEDLPPGAERAFDDGVDRAAADPAGITSLLFSVRAQGLFGEYAADALPFYLSGLLIGAEIGHARAHAPARRVTVIASGTLWPRYRRALKRLGIEAEAAPGTPAAAGLAAIARVAGLLGG